MYEKLPIFIYRGLVTAIILDYLIPHNEVLSCTKTVRNTFLFGGVCAVLWLSYTESHN